MCPNFPQKWQTQAGLPCILSLEKVDSLGLDSFKSTLIFLDGETSMGLTTSLTEGSEEDERTKFVEWGADTEMLSIKPNPDLSEGDFWTLSIWSSLELADLATDKSSSKDLTLSRNSIFSVFKLFKSSLASNSFTSKFFLPNSRDSIFFRPSSTFVASFAATLQSLL